MNYTPSHNSCAHLAWGTPVLSSDFIGAGLRLAREGFGPIAPCESIRERMEQLRRGGLFVSVPSEHVPDFTRTYYLRNLAKCAYVLRAASYFLPLSPTKIWDLGAGAGTFTHAYLQYKPLCDHSFKLIDRSPYQLSLAKVLERKLYLRGNVEYEKNDISAFISCTPRGDFVLASYSFCELTGSQLAEVATNIPKAAGCLILDYPHIVKKLASIGIEKNAPVIERHLSLKVSADLVSTMGQEEIKISYAYIGPSRNS